MYISTSKHVVADGGSALTTEFPVLRIRSSRMTQTISQSTQSRALYRAYAINSALRKLRKLTISTLRIRELTSFRTDHQLHPSGNYVDSYVFHTFAFGVDPATNSSVRIAQLGIAGTAEGLTTSRGTLVAAISTDSTNGGSTMAGIESRTMEVVYRRPKSSGALIICMLVTSWALTLVSVYITQVAMAKGRVESTTLMLHAVTALAILGLWGGWLGTESFGALQGNGQSYL